MLKFANNPDVSSTDTAILNGIVEGFSQVLDISKIDRIASEVKKLFEKIKIDSEGLSDEVLNRMAYHMARNRAVYLLANKQKKEPQEVPKEAPKEQAPAQPFVQPIIKRPAKNKPVENKELNPTTTELPTAEPVAEPVELPKEILPTEQPLPPKAESKNLVIRRAISDGLDSVEGISVATTPEHLYDEAQTLYARYADRFADSNSNQDVYDIVFQAAKKVAEDIVAAHQILVDKDDRKEMRAKKKEEAIKIEEERRRISEVAKIELEELVARMLKEKDISGATKQALKYFKLVYLDDKRDPEIAYLFPGTSRDQRYQWKSRAVKLIAPYVSEDARKYIGEKTKRKLASAKVLFKAAEMFLSKCQEG